MDEQDSEEQKTNVVMSKQDHVDMRFNSAELFTDIDDFSERKIHPAMSVLMSGVDGDYLQAMTQATYQTVGTAGTPPPDPPALRAAPAKVNKQIAPKHRNPNVVKEFGTKGRPVNSPRRVVQESPHATEP